MRFGLSVAQSEEKITSGRIGEGKKSLHNFWATILLFLFSNVPFQKYALFWQLKTVCVFTMISKIQSMILCFCLGGSGCESFTCRDWNPRLVKQTEENPNKSAYYTLCLETPWRLKSLHHIVRTETLGDGVSEVIQVVSRTHALNANLKKLG